MEIIPNFFYDLIARITPCICLFLLTVLSFVYPNGINKDQEQHLLEWSRVYGFWLLVILSSFAYFVALLLKLPAEFIIRSKAIKVLFFIKQKPNNPHLLASECFRICKSYDPSTKEELLTGNIPSGLECYSFVRMHSREEGFRLIKMLAEVRMCELLFLGSILIIILNTLLIFCNQSTFGFRIPLIICLLIASVSFAHLRYTINKNFEKNAILAWFMLQAKQPQ